MSVEPLNLAETRELLERLDHNPRRWLGQNFLVDGNIVRKSVELAGVTAGDRIVEVGPGLGTLTRALLSAGAEVWAIERDATLAAHLRATFGAGGRLHLTEGDAMDHPLAALPDAKDGSFKIVANLPYAISSPWMESICLGPHPSLLVLMLQREAADRLTAPVGTGHWSALTAQVDLAFERVGLHPVPANCFHPAPKVDSCLLSLRRRVDAKRLGAHARKVARLLFTQRRKQVGSSARNLFPDDTAVARWLAKLPEHGLTPMARPETIPSKVWLEIEETS